MSKPSELKYSWCTRKDRLVLSTDLTNIPNATDVVGRLGWLDHLPTDCICMQKENNNVTKSIDILWKKVIKYGIH